MLLYVSTRSSCIVLTLICLLAVDCEVTKEEVVKEEGCRGEEVEEKKTGD